MTRTIALALAASMVAVSAMAQDFIVVSSTDAALKKGQALNAGQRIALAPGKTFTAIRTSGEVLVFKGAANGVIMPGAATPERDQWRFGALMSLVQPPPEGRTFGATRGDGLCPEVAAMTTLSQIVRADEAGCVSQARSAFEAYLTRQAADAPIS